MILLNLIILLSIFSLTKQEQYWRAYNSLKVSKFTNANLINFKKYENKNNYTNHICYNTKDHKVPLIKTFCGSSVDVPAFVPKNNCFLTGLVTKVEMLLDNHEFNPLIFYSIEGCSRVGSGEILTVVMTNSMEALTDYENYTLTYKWKNTLFLELYNCSDFCEDIILENCTENNNLILFYVGDGVLLVLIIFLAYQIYKVYVKKFNLPK